MMKIMMHRSERQHYLENLRREELEDAVCLEKFMSTHYKRLASLIANGRSRHACEVFSKNAKIHQKNLVRYLHDLGVSEVEAKEREKHYPINPESFSLIGLINRELEATHRMIRICKDLIRQSDKEKQKIFFRELLNEERGEMRFLKHERDFHEKKGSTGGVLSFFLTLA